MPLKNRKQRRKWQKQYYMRNKSRILRKQKIYLCQRDPVHLRRYRLKYRFNLTFENLQDMLRKQKHRCKLCREKLKRFVIDHNRRCCPGRRACRRCIRGLLCIRCNAMLGPIEVVGLKKIRRYLDVTKLV